MSEKKSIQRLHGRAGACVLLIAVLLVLFALAGCSRNVDPETIPPQTVPSIPVTAPQTKAPETAAPTVPETTAPATEAPTEAPTEPVTEAPTTEAPAVYTPSEKTMYATGTVNVRAADNTDAEILGRLKLAEAVQQLAEGDNGWRRVSYKGQEAYVSGRYLSEKQPETPAPYTPPAVRDVTIHGSGNGQLIVIDPGHQRRANKEQEPVGPGSDKTKKKVTAGCTGVVSKIEESVVVLKVGLRLRDLLVENGYRVIMVRESQDVDISNIERAQIANKYKADAFLRLHINSTDSSSVRGANPIITTKNNPWNGNLYSKNKKLASCVLEAYCEATGIKSRGVKESDDYSGNNWAEVPTILFEMGFMSNPEEDRLLTDAAFQENMAKGIVNGLNRYFGQ
ncbi:MAG: N-acetylmuramoyl-L-alanine amidase [Lachnospiraceae bacterium]|nr:N-acetylmuramoyl-L-alanine amidase [Lachnospiraceae bacterium]